jgi:hypothetical protein
MSSSKNRKPEPTLVEELEAALTQNLDENDRLRAELSRLREELAAAQGRLDAMVSAFDANGTLGVLQHIAHDASMPPELRVRAAGLAVPFEKPKLSMTANVAPVRLYDRLEEAWRRDREKVIEHQPEPTPAA